MNPTTEQSVAPTGRHKVLYYVLGLTPPAEHAEWVRRDVASARWLVRRGAGFAVGFLLGGLIVGALLDSSLEILWGVVVGGVLGSVIQLTVMRASAHARVLREAVAETPN